MPSPEKFMESLHRFKVDDDVIRQINDGYENLVSRSSPMQKRPYFKRAMDILDKSISCDMLINLMDWNACCRGRSSRERASKAFAKEHAAKTLQERFSLISNVPYMGNPALTDDGKLYLLALQNFRDGAYRCACPTLNTRKKNEIQLSKSYCMCCAGHFRYHYQIMLGCGLQLERIVSSPLDTNGTDPCAFLFQITHDSVVP